MLLLIAGVALLQAQVPNGSFSESSGGRPVGWHTQTWAGSANYRLVQDSARGGCVQIESPEGVDGGWQAAIRVKPYSKVRITAWIRTEGLTAMDGQGALLNLHSRPEHTSVVKGTMPWTQVEMTVETKEDDTLIVNCLVGYYGRAKGTAWFDDVAIQTLEEGAVPVPNPTIQLDKAGEPISDYIYSQFIEHLGRCIYGGIWAEMLEDRKFFYPVGSKESPWKGSASQVRSNPLSGSQSTSLQGRVTQRVKMEPGKEYVGRVVARGNGLLTVGLGDQEQRFPVASSEWRKFEFRFRSKSPEAEFSLNGPRIDVGAVSLMPADNVSGMRRDTLQLLKQLNAPLYRWPGGNFASGYVWRDGIGDPDRRPTRKNPAWQGIDSNDFGTHEFLAFCQEVKTEPLIVVNTGFGDSTTACQWLQYVNGSSPERLANGRKAPWNVRWWGIGNEMFGSWQLGYMSLEQYTYKHNDFVDRMRLVDPRIKTIAVGDTGPWSRGMLEHCADRMDLMSEHFYCQERPGVAAHVAQIPNAIRGKVEAHRKYRQEIPALKGKNVKIAMDEWNYWYGPHEFGELGTRYFLKDGLGIAAGLQEFYRSTDIVGMANYAQTVNVIGCIKTSPTHAAMETTGLVLQMYREHYGTVPLAAAGETRPLYISAALTSDRKTLTLGIVNPTNSPVKAPLTYSGGATSDSGECWFIAGNDPMAYNDPDRGSPVAIEHRSVTGLRSGLTVPPYSASVIRVPLAGR